MEVINDLLGYQNLKIYQNTNMFQFSLDSVVLANIVTVNKKIKYVFECLCAINSSLSLKKEPLKSASNLIFVASLQSTYVYILLSKCR